MGTNKDRRTNKKKVTKEEVVDPQSEKIKKSDLIQQRRKRMKRKVEV